MYKCFLIPVLEYSAVVIHPMLTREQASSLEKLQADALRIIFGRKRSYRSILEELEGVVEDLGSRRQAMVDRFILKTADNEQFKEKWFPKKQMTDQNLRKHLFYEEKFARTNRLYNAPIFYIIGGD